ncbi:Protein argonaute-4 [Sarracenia purpurea var. burkii]
MESSNVSESLPPPSPPPLAPSKRTPIARNGFGSKGQKLPLLTNHFKVGVARSDTYFFHYSVSLFYEDGNPVEAKGIGRRILEKVQETYDSELAGKIFAYDGEKSLFTVGSLPQNKLEFTVVLENLTSNRNTLNGSPEGGGGSSNEADRKRTRRPYNSKTFKVAISYAARIPMQAIVNALRGQDSDQFQEAVRVLDIILRQHAAKQ